MTAVEDTRRIYGQYISFLDFPTYTLDASPISNPLFAVGLSGLSNRTDRERLVVDPDWMLAAWSADQNDTSLTKLSQSIFDGIEPAWQRLTTPNNDNTIDEPGSFLLMHLYSILQSVSIVPYQYEDITRNITARPLSNQHVFHTWSLRHVWAYGFDSRSSIFGLVIVSAGILCTLLRFIVGVLPQSQDTTPHEAVDFVLAALKYQSQLKSPGDSEHSPEKRQYGFSNKHTRRQAEMNTLRRRYRIKDNVEGELEFSKISSERASSEHSLGIRREEPLDSASTIDFFHAR